MHVWLSFEVCETDLKPIVNQPKQIKCTICKEKHSKPSGGFPVDVSLQKLLSLKPVEIYRGEVHRKAQNTTNRLNASLDQLKENIKKSNEKLNGFCNSLRYDINTLVDGKVSLLETHRKDLLLKLGEYEAKCQNNIVETNDKFKLFGECYQDYNLKNHGWQELIKRPNLTDSDISVVIETAEMFIQKVEENIAGLDEHLFDYKKIEFVENDREIQIEDIGKLVELSIKY
jgi:hypothetical protein